MPDQFIDKRVKVRLHDATLLRRGDEKRHHFRVSINLSEEGVLAGTPEWVQNCFTLLQKSGNQADDLKSKRVMLENVSLGFWPTEKARSKFFSQVMGATLSKFSMQREGKGEDADVALYFSIKTPARKEIHAWTFDHKSADFWMDFEQMQGDLELEDEKEKG
jgi:hypothetical protein